jgi:hypothetical protein
MNGQAIGVVHGMELLLEVPKLHPTFSQARKSSLALNSACPDSCSTLRVLYSSSSFLPPETKPAIPLSPPGHLQYLTLGGGGKNHAVSLQAGIQGDQAFPWDKALRLGAKQYVMVFWDVLRSVHVVGGGGAGGGGVGAGRPWAGAGGWGGGGGWRRGWGGGGWRISFTIHIDSITAAMVTVFYARSTSFSSRIAPVKTRARKSC